MRSDPHDDPSPADVRVVPPRRRWLGAVVAIVALLGLGALAWYLTHRPAAPAGGAFAAMAAGSNASGVAGPDLAGPGGPGGNGGRGSRYGASTVGIATAARADLPVVLEALGTVVPSITVTVRPQVSGVITSIPFTEGQMVKKGQLLATIDPRPFEIALQQAIGARMRDEAQIENGKVQLQRYQTLLGQDSIARQDVDTQAAAVKQTACPRSRRASAAAFRSPWLPGTAPAR